MFMALFDAMDKKLSERQSLFSLPENVLTKDNYAKCHCKMKRPGDIFCY